MSESEPTFWEFALGILRGLAQAFRTDINVFLLGLFALVGGNRKGLFQAGLLYVIFRRADEYMGLVARLLSQPHTVRVEPTVSHIHDD